MREPLTVAVAQPPCAVLDVPFNVAAHAATVAAAGARVVIFPELSVTGYDMSARPVAFSELAPIVAACASTGSVALIGAPVEGPSIGMLAIDGDGVRIAYRKVNLAAHEAVSFVPGPGPAVLQVDGWRLGLAICKDTGVPSHSAAAAEWGMDAYVAGIADHPSEALIIEERARRVATTCGVFVAFASFAGLAGPGYSETLGRSGVWGPGGVELARAGTAPGETAQATLTAT